MDAAARLGIPMCRAIEVGVCAEGAYALHSWVDGQDAEPVPASLDTAAQYRYGLEAGRILAALHTIPAPDDLPQWETSFGAKIDRKIAAYEGCALKYDSGEEFPRCIAENRVLLR